MRRPLGALLLGLLLALEAPAEDAAAPDARPARLEHELELLDDLRARGVLSAAEHSAEAARAWERARQPDPREEPGAARGGGRAPASGGDAAGRSSFLNTVSAIAGVLFALALLQLLSRYVWPWVRRLPEVVWELGLHGLAAGGVLAAPRAGPDHAPWVALVGCLLWGAAVAFSYTRRAVQRERWDVRTEICLLLTLLAGGATVWVGSPLLGYLAVATLMATLGFSVLVIPGCMIVGYRERSVVPRATASAFVVTGLAVAAQLRGAPPPADLFVDAGLQVAGAVFLVGLLILSNRFYGQRSRTHYMALQLGTLLLCLTVGWVGASQEIDVLRRYAGTTLILFLMEKYWEVPWGKALAVWAALLFSVLLYGAAALARQHPAWFVV